MSDKKQTKFLNIDSLVTQDFVVTINGQSYPVEELTVESFLKLKKIQSDFNSIVEPSLQEQADFLVNSILIGIPTCSPEILRGKCSVAHLNVIQSFINSGEIPEDSTPEADAVSDAKKPQKSKTKAV